MKKNNDINIEIEKTLSSLDGVQRRKASPDFYAGIQRKLANQESPRIHWLQAVAVAVLIGLNVGAVVWMQSNDSVNQEAASYLESEGYFSTMTVSNTIDYSGILEIEQ